MPFRRTAKTGAADTAPVTMVKNKGCYNFLPHDRSPKVIFRMISLFLIIVYTEDIVNISFIAS